jgi:hypothetical protein
MKVIPEALLVHTKLDIYLMKVIPETRLVHTRVSGITFIR